MSYSLSYLRVCADQFSSFWYLYNVYTLHLQCKAVRSDLTIRPDKTFSNFHIFSDNLHIFTQIFSNLYKTLHLRDQCKLSVSHEGKHSPSSTYCRYQHLHKNRVYICGKCYQNGDRSEVSVSIFRFCSVSIFRYCRVAIFRYFSVAIFRYSSFAIFTYSSVAIFGNLHSSCYLVPR